jgi:glycosyltransferase involved in cell wall biosynthesis
MKFADPLLSVIVPTYNAARFLPDAIASIRCQQYAPLEILVVDDGSTDETARVVRSLGEDIRYARQANAGPAAARNRGLELAAGEWIAFLDADDQWPADKLANQIPRLAGDPNLDIVLGRIQQVDAGAHKLLFPFEGPDQTLVHVHLGSGVFRRRVFDRVGRFDESMRTGEDVDWFLRAKEQGVPLVILPQITLHYRLHQTNSVWQTSQIDGDLLRALKKSLDRRRGAGGVARPLPQLSQFDEASAARLAAGRPLVSAVIPAFNGARFIRAALDSVLAQEYSPVEILVVDDGSFDNTADIVAACPGVRLLRQRNRGVAVARNIGVRCARGEFIAFLDQDDLWTPEKLRLQVDALLRQPELGYILCRQRAFLEPGCERPDYLTEEQYRNEGGRFLGMMLARKSLFLDVGFFHPGFRIASDAEWFFRAQEKRIPSLTIPQVLLQRRIHQGNHSYQDGRAELAEVVRLSLQRRRAVGS